jgi:phytoene synthase
MTYAEGASVAPAGIFIYVIACDVGRGSRTRLRLPQPADAYARDLARFCYLVHMLRDLAPDVRAGVATLPADLLRETRLDRGRLARAVRTHDAPALLPLASALLAKAARFRCRAGKVLATLEPRLEPDAKAALAGVRARYEATYAVLAADYARYLESTGWGDAVAASVRPE